MGKTVIRSTEIIETADRKIVHLVIANDPELDKATVVIDCSMPVATEHKDWFTLTEIQRESLEYLRTVVGHEIQRVKETEGQRQARRHRT